MFKDIVNYCKAVGNPFECYEDAQKAFLKHKERVALREFEPFHKRYHKLVREYFRKIKKYRFYPLYDYDFQEVLDFLKKHHYFGKQCFDCRGTCDDPDIVYNKDGVHILFEGSYDYIEVLGLRPSDYYVIAQAYERIEKERYKWMEEHCNL